MPAFVLMSVLESSSMRLARRLGRRALWLSIAGSVLVIATLTGLSAAYIRNEAARRASVDHTYAVLETLGRLQLDINRLQNLSRAYLITGNAKHFLGYADDVRADMAQSEALLASLVADNPPQEVKARLLARQLDLRAALDTRIVALKRAGRDKEAIALQSEDSTWQLGLDERATFLAMQMRERALLAEREAAASQAEARAVDLAGFGGVLSVAILLIAVYDAKRQADLRVEAEREIRKTEERFRLLVEGVRDYAILLLDRQGHVASWNEGAERIKGYRAEEIVGRHFSCFYPLESLRAGLPDVELRAATENGRYEDEGWRVRKDGTRFWANVIITAMYDEDGRLSGFSKVTRDLSEHKRVEDALRHAKEAAEAATRAKSDFLAAMSHELRTPMTGVLGMIDLMRRNPAPEDYTLFLNTLRSSAKTLMTVLGDILDFSKIEAGRLELETVDFAVGDLVGEVIGLFTGQASMKGLAIHPLLSGVAGVVVRGDPTRLRQILSNLIGNAIKFTHEGRIEVVVTPPQSGVAGIWRFEVRDTGIGFAMDEAHRQFLFDAFTQADLTTTRRFGGTGLGLAICKRLIDAMGGTIGAESTLGAGSTFWFEVPLAAGLGRISDLREPSDPFQPPRRALKVLIAEDNQVNQLIITYMLQQMGHAATCVENGRLALERVQQDSFDIVLMDMQMPEMDGATASRCIRALPEPLGALPIVALTADATTAGREAYLEAGLTDFLTKPIDPEALRRVLDRVIEMAT